MFQWSDIDYYYRLYGLASKKNSNKNISSDDDATRDLTFSPQLVTHNYNKNIGTAQDDQKVYDRLYNPNYHSERDLKLQALRNEFESQECTFSPNILSSPTKRGNIPPTPRSSMITGIDLSLLSSEVDPILKAEDIMDQLNQKVSECTPPTPRSSMMTDTSRAQDLNEVDQILKAEDIMDQFNQKVSEYTPPTPRSSMITGTYIPPTPRSSAIISTAERDLSQNPEENTSRKEQDEVDLLILKTMQELSILEEITNEDEGKDILNLKEEYAQNLKLPPEDDLDVIEKLLESGQEPCESDLVDIIAQKYKLISDP